MFVIKELIIRNDLQKRAAACLIVDCESAMIGYIKLPVSNENSVTCEYVREGEKERSSV